MIDDAGNGDILKCMELQRDDSDESRWQLPDHINVAIGVGVLAISIAARQMLATSTSVEPPMPSVPTMKKSTESPKAAPSLPPQQ